MKLTYDSAIDKYNQLRDRIKEVQKAADAEKAQLTETLVKLENWITEHADKDGLENIKTEHGTAYWSTQSRASVADPSAFFDFVLANKRWDLLDKRVSRSAAKLHVEETGEAPPGVNYHTLRVFNVRRARKTDD